MKSDQPYREIEIAALRYGLASAYRRHFPMQESSAGQHIEHYTPRAHYLSEIIIAVR